MAAHASFFILSSRVGAFSGPQLGLTTGLRAAHLEETGAAEAERHHLQNLSHALKSEGQLVVGVMVPVVVERDHTLRVQVPRKSTRAQKKSSRLELDVLDVVS